MRNEQIIQGDEIDIVQLFKTILEGRKIIYYSIALSFFIGLLILLVSPVKYKASAVLLPSSEKKGGSLSGLSSLAGLAGINLNGLTDASTIDPELYTLIIESTPFKKELISQKFDFEGYEMPISFLELASDNQMVSFSSLILKYTVKLPITIKNALVNKTSSGILIKKHIIPIQISTESEQKALDEVSKITNVTVDPKTGLVIIEVELKEAVLVAQVTTKVVDMLQHYVIEYKTKQVVQNLAFIKGNYIEKSIEFEKAQKALYDYRDKNRNVISERTDIQYQRLSDTYDLASSVYKGVAQQYEQVKLQVKEETPVFSIIEPVQMPFEKSAPKSLMIVVFSLIFGAVFGSVLILPLRFYYKSLYDFIIK